MNNRIKKRVIEEGNYIVETKETVREVAKKFKVSKSTVHKDMQERLSLINRELFNDVIKVFNKHIEIRHINGGEATRLKYLKLKKV